jgi:hypothetical protein
VPRATASDNRVLILAWQDEGRRYGNHYVQMAPPVDLAQYLAALPTIGAPAPAIPLEALWRLEH